MALKYPGSDGGSCGSVLYCAEGRRPQPLLGAKVVPPHSTAPCSHRPRCLTDTRQFLLESVGWSLQNDSPRTCVWPQARSPPVLRGDAASYAQDGEHSARHRRRQDLRRCLRRGRLQPYGGETAHLRGTPPRCARLSRAAQTGAGLRCQPQRRLRRSLYVLPLPAAVPAIVRKRTTLQAASVLSSSRKRAAAVPPIRRLLRPRLPSTSSWLQHLRISIRCTSSAKTQLTWKRAQFIGGPTFSALFAKYGASPNFLEMSTRYSETGMLLRSAAQTCISQRLGRRADVHRAAHPPQRPRSQDVRVDYWSGAHSENRRDANPHGVAHAAGGIFHGSLALDPRLGSSLRDNVVSDGLCLGTLLLGRKRPAPQRRRARLPRGGWVEDGHAVV